MNNRIYIVRAGREAVHVDTFVSRGLMAMGFCDDIGAEALSMDRAQLQERMAAVYPEWNKHRTANHSGQFHRFKSEIQVGDTVGTYDPNLRLYFIGRVTSEARYDGRPIPEYPYVRSVEWTHRVDRDSLSVRARNSLGAIQTVFQLDEEVTAELFERAVPRNAPVAETPPPPQPDAADTTIDDLKAETLEKAEKFIEDAIAKLHWDQVQELVAGILRAMGYKTRVYRSKDRGVDVFASPDGLGLEEPRIFVEVKHRSAPMGAPDIRSFLGGRKPGDRCLYVSTKGFTTEARYEADRANVPLSLLSVSDLRELLTEYYEALDPDTRRLVPLTRLYWPLADG